MAGPLDINVGEYLLKQLSKFQQIRDVTNILGGTLDELLNFLDIQTKILEALFGEVDSSRKNFHPANVKKLIDNVYEKATARGVIDADRETIQRILRYFVEQIITAPQSPLPGFGEQLEELYESIVTIFAFDVEEDGESHPAVYLISLLLQDQLIPLMNDIITTMNRIRNCVDSLASSNPNPPDQKEIISKYQNLYAIIQSEISPTQVQNALQSLSSFTDQGGLLEKLILSFMPRLTTLRDLLIRLKNDWDKLVSLFDRIKVCIDEFEDLRERLGERVSKIILPKFNSLITLFSSEEHFEVVKQRVEEILKYFVTGKEALDQLTTPITVKGTTIYDGQCTTTSGSTVVLVNSIENIQVGDRFWIGTMQLGDSILVPTTTHPASGVDLEKDYSIGSFTIQSISEDPKAIIIDYPLTISGDYHGIVYRGGSKYWGHLWSILTLFWYKYSDLVTTEALDNTINLCSQLISKVMSMASQSSESTYRIKVRKEELDILRNAVKLLKSSIFDDLDDKIGRLTEFRNYCQEFVVPENPEVVNLLWYLQDLGANRLSSLVKECRFSELMNVSINDLTSFNKLWDILSSQLTVE